MRSTTLALVSGIAGLALVAGPFASVATAELLAGKGSAKTNCYVEYDVGNVANPGPQVELSGGRVLCTDGDPCDTDGACGNNSCTISVAVCANQTDPNVAGCTPPSGLKKLKVKAKKTSIALPATFTGPVCAASSSVTVGIPTKKNGKLKKKFGSVKLTGTAKALPGVKPAGASDSLELRCLPRANPCLGIVNECHNGVVQPGEACDPGSVDTEECVNCTGPTTCGDGFTGRNEPCDDGNTVAGDGCSSDCRIEGGGLTATVTLDYDANQILELVGVELNVFYPTAKVAIPGTGDTDQVKARVTNLGNQSNQFQANDFDDHLFVISGGTDASAFQPGPLAKVVFDLLPGQTAVPGDFSCQVTLAVDSLGLDVGPPTCSVTVATTPPPTTTP